MISVITASIPSRTAMLAECMASVARQSLRPLEHIVAVDHARYGSAATRNAALGGVRGDWTAVVDDDDLLWTEHLARLSTLTEKADIVYSWCEVAGKSWNPNSDFNAERLRNGNYIPATSLIRTKFLRKLKGWRDSADSPGGLEDWDLWLRALDAGGRFVCLPEITWTYRFHGGNKSVRGEVGAE